MDRKYWRKSPLSMLIFPVFVWGRSIELGCGRVCECSLHFQAAIDWCVQHPSSHSYTLFLSLSLSYTYSLTQFIHIKQSIIVIPCCGFRRIFDQKKFALTRHKHIAWMCFLHIPKIPHSTFLVREFICIYRSRWVCVWAWNYYS